MANALPLLLIGGAAVMMLGGKKKRGTSTKPSDCPSEFSLNVEDVEVTTVEVEVPGGSMEVSYPKIAGDEVARGNKDIGHLISSVLGGKIPTRCFGDPKVLIRLSGPGGEATRSAPDVYFVLGTELIEDLFDATLLTQDEAVQSAALLAAWWNEHMPGQPFPKSL